ncbi:MAG: hypothetical protein PHO03_03330 [Candidatus Omnitrophica bacterium]|nr:hypothetical protein [Candidatus Omnitrophota bacterium]
MTRKALIFAIGLILIINLAGCEAFTRKFTRKSKKDKEQVEMVLAPEEWKGPKMTKEEQYRQYFVFWQSWQDELVSVLMQNGSQKKKLDCAQQAMKNLVNMRALLNESKQKQLDVYLRQLVELQQDIKADIYGTANNFYFQKSEKIRLNILQHFSYNDVKNDLL